MAAGDVSVSFPKVYRDGPNDGTVSGGFTIDDGAMEFDGVDGKVNLGDTGWFVNGTQTISLWFNASKGSERNQYLITHAVTGANSNRFYIVLSNTDTLRITIGSTAYDIPGGASAWNENEWNNILVVRDQANSKAYVYLNGIQYVNSSLTTIGSEVTTEISLGWEATVDPVQKFNGSLNNVLIFNKDVQAKAMEIYNAGKDAYSPVTDGLVFQASGRDYVGTEATPTKIYDTKNIGKGNDNTFIDTAFSEMRVNANSKFLMVPGHRGQVYVTHIEESP
jgi:hypothetical protein